MTLGEERHSGKTPFPECIFLALGEANLFPEFLTLALGEDFFCFLFFFASSDIMCGDVWV
jgi:hypothetical protein